MLMSILLLGGSMAIGQTDFRKQSKPAAPAKAAVSTSLMSVRGGQKLDANQDKTLVRGKTVYEVMKARFAAENPRVAVKMGNIYSNAVKAAGVPAPYKCTFDYARVLEDEWVTVDGDGDEYAWDYYTGDVVPSYDGDEANGFVGAGYNADDPTADYLITKAPIQMAAGKAYVGFYYRAAHVAYVERLQVYWSKTETTDLAKMKKIGELETSSADWLFTAMPFELEEAGAYYFCFLHCSDADQYSLFLDDIEIANGEFVGTPDLAVTQVLLPASACGLGEEQVGAVVRNTGKTAITKLKLAYTVGETSVEQTFEETIEIGETKNLYFTQKADFSEEGAYKVTVSGTVLASEGTEEENTENNSAEGRVVTFSPVESLPFAVNLSDEEDLDQLGYDAAVWEYDGVYELIQAHDTMPLFTRCMSLEANTVYRFMLDYVCGYTFWFWAVPDNFDVLYGKAGTPVSKWEVLKEYRDEYTYDELTHDEIWFENEEAGDYSFAILPRFGEPEEDEETGEVYDVPYNGSLFVGAITVEAVPDHDVRIELVKTTLAAKIPAQHAMSPEIAVVVSNRGKNDEGDVKVTVKAGTATVGESEEQEIESADLSYYYIYGELARPAVGTEVKLTVAAEMSATDANPEDNVREWTFEATDELYAYDDMTIEAYEDGISTSNFIFGNMFTLAEQDTLTAIELGLFDLTMVGYEDDFISAVEVYSVDGDEAKACLLVHEFVRPVAGGNAVRIEVPARVLPAGSYLIALRELDGSVGVGFDGVSDADLYIMWEDGEIENVGDEGYGYLAVRALFGRATKIVKKDIELTSVAVRAKGLLTANEPITVNYRNNGMDAMEVTFNCTVNGVLDSKKVTVPGYGIGTLQFIADMAKVGTYDIKVEAVAEGDEVADNNGLKAAAECLEANPYVMDFELCEDFTIDNLAPWKAVDVDGDETYAMSSSTWPNAYQPQAFIAFNPVLAERDEVVKTHGGERLGMAFASVNMANDDWLISPKVLLPEEYAKLTYFAKIFDPAEEGYVEAHEIMVSTATDAPEDFVKVAEFPDFAETEWTEIYVDLSAYNGKEVYVAFHYIAEDQYALMLDDIKIGKSGLVNEQTVDLSRYVKSYPNPVSDVWTVTAYGLEINRVELCNMQGGIVFRSAGNLATETYRVNMNGFTPGLYMARVYTNAGVQMVKVTVR